MTNKKMYVLLPFQVFNTRKAVESISNSSKTHEEKAQLINVEFNKLIKVIENVGKSSADLYEKEEINLRDFERILLVLKNISDYIYNKYGEYFGVGRRAVGRLDLGRSKVSREVFEGMGELGLL